MLRKAVSLASVTLGAATIAVIALILTVPGEVDSDSSTGIRTVAEDDEALKQSRQSAVRTGGEHGPQYVPEVAEGNPPQSDREAQRATQTVTVPTVTRLLETDARDQILRAGLRIGESNRQESSLDDCGRVLETIPPSGTPVEERAVIHIVVGSGPNC